MKAPTKAIAKPLDLYAGMNGTEREYAILLEAQKRRSLISDWRFEEVTFILAHDCRYTPDFYVQMPDGSVELHETKGFWREDAKAKIRIAARLWPAFTFRAYRKRTKKEGGGWIVQEFQP